MSFVRMALRSASLLTTYNRALPVPFLARQFRGVVYASSQVPHLAGGNGSGAGRGSGSGHGGWGQGPSGSGGESWGPNWGAAAAVAAAGLLLQAGPAAAKAQPVKAQPKEEELTIDNVTDMLWNIAGPVLTNLGFSGCVGAAAGLALKKIGSFVAFLVGIAFIVVQGLAYTGVITVNWTKVNNLVVQTFDVNKDGKLDQNDFKHFVSGGLAALAQGVPSVGGFLAGFLYAVRYL